MEILCPECRGALATTDRQSARCATHGADYRILFWREPAAAAPPVVLTAVTMCRAHPQVPATVNCGHCGAAICELCSFKNASGQSFCSGCFGVVTAAASGTGPGMMAGTKCVNHPNAAAVKRCRSCSVSLCPTCAFDFPGGITLCPKCATTQPQGLSPSRKKLLLIAYPLAIWCTVAIVGLLGYSATHRVRTADAKQALGLAFFYLVIVPSLIGTGVSVAALERRLGNTMAVWGAVIWNGLILGGMILLCVVGLMLKR